jgi:GH25 family lysozyme M1 (1,4-beta-N-acetylmuramidase)
MRATGIDISYYQGAFQYKGNIDFVIIKATEGTLYTDPNFAYNLEEVQRVPIRGAYHYFRSSMNAMLQAEHFLDMVHGRGFHFLAVDYEKANNTLGNDAQLNLKDFWDHLKKLTDLPLILYTSPYIYRDQLCALNVFWGSVPIWMAHYNGMDPQNASPWLFDASEWILWQYSNTGMGRNYGVGSLDVDLNVFNGTPEDMVEYFQVGQPVIPPVNIRAETIRECIEALEELL